MDPLDHQPLDRRAEAAQLALERPDTPDATTLIDELETRAAFRGRRLGKQLLWAPGGARPRAGRQAEALGLYESFGFERRTAFGTYRDDPLSLYLEKHI